MARVVLIESFYSGSHRSWADRWIEHSGHDIALLSLPGEFWRWRLRGGAATLAGRFGRHVAEAGPPDAVVCSSLLDVAAFAGHARRALGSTPLALYMHESQLLYPLAPNQRPDTAAALINWQSMLAADQVWFNSSYHRNAIRAALPDLLATQPDLTQQDLVDDAFAKSCVLWPGVHTAELVRASRTQTSGVGTGSSADGPLVLWNQRWDHDKNPGAVFGALAAVAETGVPFRLAVAGENQRHHDSGFEAILDRLRDRIVHRGYASPEQYRSLLLAADAVVSAADHEFFGMAVVEAIAGGAVPLLPNRLSYPEVVQPRWHDSVLYGHGELRPRVRSLLVDLEAARAGVDGLRDSMLRFDVAASAQAHDRAVDDLLERLR